MQLLIYEPSLLNNFEEREKIRGPSSFHCRHHRIKIKQ